MSAMDDLTLLGKLVHSTWFALTDDDRQVVVDAISQRLPPEFELAGLVDHGVGVLAEFVHRPSAARFVLVPGGSFEMGFGDAERARILALAPESEEPEWVRDVFSGPVGAEPLRLVDVAPHLIAQRPLRRPQLELVLEREDCMSEACCIEPEFADAAIEGLARLGLRPPSEAEWEHANRAGTRTLFPAGIDDLPVDPYLPENGFGLFELGQYPELCADGWHGNYEGAPSDARPWPGKQRVVRGGAAMSWPWQGPGWLECLCASRTSLAQAEFFLALRPALSLFPDEVAYAERAVALRLAAGPTTRPIPERAAREPRDDDENDDDENEDDENDDDDAPATIVHDMYDRACGDLAEIAGADESDALARLAELRRLRFPEDGSGRYYSGESADLTGVIIELLLDPGTAIRHELALLLLDLITGDHEKGMPRLDWRREGFAGQDRCMLALLARHRELLALLDDPDPRVRSAIAMLLAAPLQSAWAHAMFVERIEDEDDVAVRASLVMAAGVSMTGVERVHVPHDRFATLLAGAPISACAAAHASIAMFGEMAEPEAFAVLERAIGTTLPADTWFPWYHGSLDRLARSALLHAGEPGQAAYTRGAIRRLAELAGAPEREAKREATRHANALLDLHFRYHGTPTPAELSTTQREVLAALSTDDAPDCRCDRYGLPTTPAERRAWLDA
ncbi:formylglycine-generating enzyme family protein [Nannocystaceae bacterium ST9]